MISIYDTTSLEIARNQPLEPELRVHIDRHLELARQNGLADDATHILVVQPGDTERTIEDEIGFSPVIDMEGRRHGDPAFVPYWAHLQDRGDHFEIVETIGNSGFAFIILVLKTEGVWPELLALCREHAG